MLSVCRRSVLNGISGAVRGVCARLFGSFVNTLSTHIIFTILNIKVTLLPVHAHDTAIIKNLV